MTSLLLLKQLRLAQNPVAYKIKSSVIFWVIAYSEAVICLMVTKNLFVSLHYNYLKALDQVVAPLG